MRLSAAVAKPLLRAPHVDAAKITHELAQLAGDVARILRWDWTPFDEETTLAGNDVLCRAA